MNRGRGRQTIFPDRADYERFMALLGETCGMWGLRVHAYSLLPNHYHLLVETPHANLSRALRHLNGLYTQRYNRAHLTDGPLFRGRYKAILVAADSYLLQLVRYIHRNPVEAGLVKDPSRHPWTSHRHYLGQGQPPAGLVMEEVLGRFAPTLQPALRQYKAFMSEKVDEQTLGLYARGNLPAIWGTEAFCEEIRARIGNRKLNDEIPQSRQERSRPTLRQIERVVCEGYRVEGAQLYQKRRGIWNEPRNVAIYLARQRIGYPLKEIGARWGGLKYSSISSMVYAMKQRIEKDHGVRARVDEIEKALIKRQT
jgi:REP element-mobilizing transposase RayT